MGIGLFYLGAHTVVSIIAFAVVARVLARMLHRKVQPLLLSLYTFTIVLLASMVAYSITQLFPKITERIEITAMKEGGEESGGLSVEVVGVEVDGRDWELGELKDGFWAATGSGYKWVPKKDISNGVKETASIALEIPVGFSRTLLFSKLGAGGKARVSYGEATYGIDTSTTSELRIRHSSKLPFALSFAYMIALYALVLGGLLFLLYALYVRIRRNKVQSRFWYAVIAVAALCAYVVNSAGHVFWLDELYQVGFSGAGKSLYETLMVVETSPPLFRLMANLWLRVVPYAEEWALLLPELLCAVAVFMAGVLCERLTSRTGGLLGACFVATSSTVALHAAHQFRGYGLLLLLSCVLSLLFCELVSTKKPPMRTVVAYGVCMLAISYTHYFGLLLCGVFFLQLLLLSWHKLVRMRWLVSYAVLFVGYLPWVVHFVGMGHLGLTAEWMMDATAKTIFTFLYLLCNNHLFELMCVCLGLAVAVGTLRVRALEGIAVSEYLRLVFPVLTCVLTFAIMYCYGKIVNQKATLLYDRYFIILVPHICCMICTGLCWVMGRLKRVMPYACAAVVLVLMFTNYADLLSLPLMNQAHTTFEIDEAADWLYNKDDLVFGTSGIVFVGYKSSATTGIEDYYLTKRGRRAPICIVSKVDFYEQLQDEDFRRNEFLNTYQTIYALNGPNPMRARVEKFINKYYHEVERDDEKGLVVYTRDD